MKLIRFGKLKNEKPGILINGIRRDCSAHFEDWNHEFFREGGLKKLSKMIKDTVDVFPKVSYKTRWGSCVSRPNMIMCVALNYSDHALETGKDIPKEPILFMKATNSINGPYDSISIPKGSTKTDWEVELAIILNKDIVYSKNEEQAMKSIAGYCLMNDLSEREFQLEKGGQWVKGKSCPGFSPVGPYLVTPDEIPNVQNLKMNLKLNGEDMQNGNTKTMIFKPAFIVHYISQFMQLEAGDIITTGTPPGVGIGKNPPRYIKYGDVVESSIDYLGSQKQQFI